MSPSRVLVNLTWLVPGVVGGSEESTTDLLRALLAEAPSDLELHLAVLEPFAAAHPDLAAALPCEVLGLDGSDKRRRVLAEQTWLAARARRLGAEVVHHAGGVVPFVHPGRVVVTIHDLQPLELSRNFSFAKRTYIRAMAGRSVRAARVVCVPSEFTRSRVLDLLGGDDDRVVVVPWSVRPVPPAADASVPQGVRPPFLLYPAITYPHKNHLVLLDAFAEVARVDPEVQLVLTGGEGPTEDVVRERIRSLGLDSRVVRTGRVPADQLAALYGSAAAVVVPSRYEGFGLPVLEAMARSCPVVAARAGSLPEVARPEDLVDPDDVTAWAHAMQAVLSLDPAARAERVVAGRATAALFTPHRTASAQIGAYRRALHGRTTTPTT